MTEYLVYCMSPAVVDVDDIETAPEAALDVFRESLTDQGMGIKFDVYHLDGEVRKDGGKPHMYAHVIVGGEEVGIVP